MGGDLRRYNTHHESHDRQAAPCRARYPGRGGCMLLGRREGLVQGCQGVIRGFCRLRKVSSWLEGSPQRKEARRPLGSLEVANLGPATPPDETWRQTRCKGRNSGREACCEAGSPPRKRVHQEVTSWTPRHERQAEGLLQGGKAILAIVSVLLQTLRRSPPRQWGLPRRGSRKGQKGKARPPRHQGGSCDAYQGSSL